MIKQYVVFNPVTEDYGVVSYILSGDPDPNLFKNTTLQTAPLTGAIPTPVSMKDMIAALRISLPDHELYYDYFPLPEVPSNE
ncbi:hypothetical protein CM49_04348 [Paenibacillus sp. P1XP2]|nr:hypothetical protein CM49_04348 [Paenibacillus sp. P1XP2]